MDQTEQISQLRTEIRELRHEIFELNLWRQMLPLRVMQFAIYLLSAGVIASIFITGS